MKAQGPLGSTTDSVAAAVLHKGGGKGNEGLRSCEGSVLSNFYRCRHPAPCLIRHGVIGLAVPEVSQ